MKDKNNKNIIISATTLILSIAYLTYSSLVVDSFINNLDKLIIPIFVFLLSILMFIFTSKGAIKKGPIIGFSSILVLFMIFQVVTNLNIIKLPEDEKMISYVDKSYKTLNDWAIKNKIELKVIYEYSDTITKGNIIRLDTNKGDIVKNIKTITVTVSNGPDYDKIVVVPSMIGWNIEAVVKFINDNHMIGVIVDYKVSDEIKDTVIEQNKNGDIRRNQEWNIGLSLGPLENLPTTVVMADLSNKKLFDATLWLKQNNIKYTLEYEFSDTLDRNIIVSQSVKSGDGITTATDTITLKVSKGKAIIVPDITNMSVTDITNWIVENKLRIEFVEIYDEKIESGKIISSSVNKGDKIESETLIKIQISKGQIKMQKFNTFDDFKVWASKYNIGYSISYEYSNSIAKGQVITYSYNENDIIDPEAVIYVKVSLGVPITIPSFVGKTKDNASSICNSLGIRCTFVTGNYTSYALNTVYSQSKQQGSKVSSGSSITLSLSKGVPTTKTLYIQQNWLSIGNADATITSLRSKFESSYPGVIFNFIKVKDNTLSSGMISKSSPTNHGSVVVQGNTYTIYIVSN